MEHTLFGTVYSGIGRTSLSLIVFLLVTSTILLFCGSIVWSTLEWYDFWAYWLFSLVAAFSPIIGFLSTWSLSLENTHYAKLDLKVSRSSWFRISLVALVILLVSVQIHVWKNSAFIHVHLTAMMSVVGLVGLTWWFEICKKVNDSAAIVLHIMVTGYLLFSWSNLITNLWHYNMFFTFTIITQILLLLSAASRYYRRDGQPPLTEQNSGVCLLVSTILIVFSYAPHIHFHSITFKYFNSINASKEPSPNSWLDARLYKHHPFRLKCQSNACKHALVELLNENISLKERLDFLVDVQQAYERALSLLPDDVRLSELGDKHDLFANVREQAKLYVRNFCQAPARDWEPVDRIARDCFRNALMDCFGILGAPYSSNFRSSEENNRAANILDNLSLGMEVEPKSPAIRILAAFHYSTMDFARNDGSTFDQFLYENTHILSRKLHEAMAPLIDSPTWATLARQICKTRCLPDEVLLFHEAHSAFCRGEKLPVFLLHRLDRARREGVTMDRAVLLRAAINGVSSPTKLKGFVRSRDTKNVEYLQWSKLTHSNCKEWFAQNSHCVPPPPEPQMRFRGDNLFSDE